MKIFGILLLIVGLIAAVAFVLLVGLLAVPLLKLGRVLDEARASIKEVTDHSVPILDEAASTVATTNSQLVKVDTITTSAAQVSENVSALTGLYAATFGAFDELIGLSRLKLFHVNDSVKPLGSRVDRHAGIGLGQIGLEAFRRLVTDPRFANRPMVLETPKEDADGTEMDPVNLAVLRQLAKILGDCTRRGDTVARFGGEEFMLILPETPAAGALHLAENIRATVEETVFTIEGGKEVRATVSIGLARFPDHGKSAEALIAAADGALYRSKQSGRNRITSAD